jgi:hypothetical protein
MRPPKRTKGRPRKREPKPGDRVSLGLRVTPSLKKELDRAAQTSGRSQSQEAEFRIERSFLDQRRMIEALELTFGRELAGILLVVGEAMKAAGEMTGFKATFTIEGSKAWWQNPHSYGQAMCAAITVLEEIKPAGEASPPTIDIDPTLGRACANGILEEAATGFARSIGGVERARTLHRALGPLAQRLHSHVIEEWVNAPSHIGDEP